MSVKVYQYSTHDVYLFHYPMMKTGYVHCDEEWRLNNILVGFLRKDKRFVMDLFEEFFPFDDVADAEERAM